MNLTCKNSPGWTKLETGVGVNEIGIDNLYEKIVNINTLKVFYLLNKFRNIA